MGRVGERAFSETKDMVMPFVDLMPHGSARTLLSSSSRAVYAPLAVPASSSTRGARESSRARASNTDRTLAPVTYIAHPRASRPCAPSCQGRGFSSCAEAPLRVSKSDACRRALSQISAGSSSSSSVLAGGRRQRRRRQRAVGLEECSIRRVLGDESVEVQYAVRECRRLVVDDVVLEAQVD